MSGTRLLRYMSAKHIPGRNERPSLAKRSAFMLWSTCSIVIILCLSVVALSLKAEQCPATSDLQHINATQFDSTDYSEREFMTACRNEDVAVFTVARVYAGMCTPDLSYGKGGTGSFPLIFSPSEPSPTSHLHTLHPSYAHIIDVNVNMSSEYWDYEQFEIDWGNVYDYEQVGERIGRGAYSNVFKCVKPTTGEKCVIKQLKPIGKTKIKREVLVLQTLKDGPNIVTLLDVVRDPETKKKRALIFEHIDEATDSKTLFPTLTDMEVRYYVYELLKALDYAHSKGIMHRDIKPRNIIIDHENKQLRLIDWGLAEFYHPGKEYRVSVATRSFKGPELFVDLLDYDYSLDLWSLGCTVAGIIFKREPFFRGYDNPDLLAQIVQVLGSDDFYKYIQKYGMELDPDLLEVIGTNHTHQPWETFIMPENVNLVSPEAIDFVDKLLRYDHQERMTAQEAMQHPYLAPIRTSAATQ